MFSPLISPFAGAWIEMLRRNKNEKNLDHLDSEFDALKNSLGDSQYWIREFESHMLHYFLGEILPDSGELGSIFCYIKTHSLFQISLSIPIIKEFIKLVQI